MLFRSGIINSIDRSQTWKTSDFHDEKETFESVVSNDFRWFTRIITILRDKVNINE